VIGDHQGLAEMIDRRIDLTEGCIKEAQPVVTATEYSATDTKDDHVV